MRILQLCHKPPRPSKDGGCRAMDAMTRGMIQAGHHVKVLTIATDKHPWLPEELDEAYRSETRIEAATLDTRLNRIDALSSIITGDSYNINRFYAPAFEGLLIEALKREVFDLVIFESLFTAPYLNAVRSYCDGPMVLRAHNVEHLIWEQLARESSVLSKRIYLQHLADRLKAFEVNALQDFDAIVAITEEDKRHFESLGCLCPIFELPFGLDSEVIPPESSDQADHVFHLGSMDWRPNIQGVEWFLDEVWSEVLNEVPTTELRLAGRNFPENSFSGAPRVSVLGEVSNAWEVMSASGVMIIPLQSGSGMRIKAIEAMAVGRPIVSTKIGIEGIGGKADVHYLIADDAAGFAKHVIHLLQNGSMAKRIGNEARQLVFEKFENNRLVRDLIGSLEQHFEL